MDHFSENNRNRFPVENRKKWSVNYGNFDKGGFTNLKKIKKFRKIENDQGWNLGRI